MKAITVVFLLLCFTLTQAQMRQKPVYRPAPKIGEVVAVSGILTIAAAATANMSYENDLTQSLVFVGLGICIAGVVVDLDGHKKYKRKKHKRLFATGNKIGIRVNF